LTDGYRLGAQENRGEPTSIPDREGVTMKEASDYGNRLKALKEKQARLERKQAELLVKRHAEIG
jgi:hypothetical protein